MKKILLIGAGSVIFTQGLVADLITYLDGGKATLALCDIDEEILQTVGALVEKMIQAKQGNITVELNTDRKRLLPGCDYVVSTIGVGGRRSWEQDVFIPRKYGIFQPVGDTAMPGGISRAMRMVPAMLDILNDIEALAPNAKVFNYSNPMAVLTRAFAKTSKVPVVGLCHGVAHSERHIARAMGLEREKITSTTVGFNHLSFMYDIRYEGKDLKPAMLEHYQKRKKDGFDRALVGRMWDETRGKPVTVEQELYAWELFERYGAFPAPGDRHICEFFTENFPGGQYYGKTLGTQGAFSFERCIEMGDASYAETQRLAYDKNPLPDDFFSKFAGEHEQLLEIIQSMENDQGRIFSVNLPNHGAVPNLPPQAVLELPAAATATGFRTLHCPDFPDILAAIINRFLAIIEVTAEAALTGDRGLFEQAILMGGYISDKQAVAKMVDELLAAQKQYLPQF